ncbi:M23 family metallopeptidase [Georgenia sunbinii]|uniref:M23 family metallopeptidase n=1 Tax=Georgenia sunbinii TaxID=3117728 RepID=UPI002F267330
MRRAIARWQSWWVRLFVVAVLAGVILDIPRPLDLVLVATPFLLFLVRPPATDRAPVELAPPVRGRWVAINSPGSAVPSHGVKAYGQAYAVDLVQPSDGPTAPLGWLRTRRSETYPAFGQPVRAMAPGAVVRVRNGWRDHRARDTWPAVLWMLSVEGFIRELVGTSGLFGNHVVVAHDDGTYAAYAHLRRGSVGVRPGERVASGTTIAEVGNTGNSSEPHLHVQVMDDARPTAAAGIAMSWTGLAVDPTEQEARWRTGDPKPGAQAGFPQNGQVFEATGRPAADPTTNREMSGG